MTPHPGPWWRHCTRRTLAQDAAAAAVVTLLLIPQSLAYASLAGLSPVTGLYASMLPLVVYALLGSSPVLAVGPAAVISLMTAATVGQLHAQGLASAPVLATALALVTGAWLLLMGLLRLGALAQLISHPVVVGFMNASALLIALSQSPTLLGLPTPGTGGGLTTSGWQQLWHLTEALPLMHPLTAAMGLGLVAWGFWAKHRLATTLQRCTAWSAHTCKGVARTAPIWGVLLASVWAAWADPAALGLAVLGHLPSGWPDWGGTLPTVTQAATLLPVLLLPGLVLALVGFAESISVAQSLATSQRQRVDPNRELLALGACDWGSALSGGFPVSGGFARSAVNRDAGAQTQAAGLLTALGVAAVALWGTPHLAHVPKTALAATIVVAVSGLINLKALRQPGQELWPLAVTALATFTWGVQMGLLAGMGCALALHLWHSSRPHMAEVGLVPGTQHFRNIDRHAVITHPHMVGLRVDESLYFANAKALEDRINLCLTQHPNLQHLVLLCSGVNRIDATALQTLTNLDEQLQQAGVTLHLSEVKGPVLDSLTLHSWHPKGQVFLSHYQAMQTLVPHTETATHDALPPNTP